MRNEDGSCVFISKQWFVKTMTFCISLNMNMAKLEDVNDIVQGLILNGSLSYNVPVPWNGSWELSKYMYVISQSGDNELVDEIVLEIAWPFMNEFLDITEHLKWIQYEVLKPWKVTTKSKTLLLTPTLMKFCAFTLVDTLQVTRANLNITEHVYIPVWADTIGTTNLPHKRYRSTGLFITALTDFLEITKLFFCQQIEYLTDFVAFETGGVIIIKENNRKLYENEYSSFSDYVGYKYRVCALDIGYAPVSNAIPCRLDTISRWGALFSSIVLLMLRG